MQKTLTVLACLLLAGCGAPQTEDGDGDGIVDEQEVAGWSIVVTLLDHNERRQVSSDPGEADTDGDGIPDAFEFGLGTDPGKADTDGDGLTDCQESFHTVLVDCEDPGWRGTSDGGYRTVPNRADSDPGFSRYVNLVGAFEDRLGAYDGNIPWGDGLSDGEEVLGIEMGNGTTVRLDPLRHDSDGDHLEDGEELLQYGTDPTVPDTDGDGCVDGLDPVPTYPELFVVDLDFRIMDPAGTDVLVQVAGTSAEPPVGEDGTARTETRPGACSIPPTRPWIPVEVLAFRDGVHLDLTSATHPGGGHRMYWDLSDGSLSWEPDGAGDATADWKGADGSLRIELTVAQAS